MKINTKIIKVDPSDSVDKLTEKLRSAAQVIKRGGLVAFPTETVYGLGADATSPIAAQKIYEAKGRPSDNPLIIHISKPSDAEGYTYTNETYYKLARYFMPGPLTVVLRSKESIPPATRGGLDTVAVRCPSNPVANQLIALSEVPIAAPSANLSGTPSPTCAKHVEDDMTGRADVIIDGGDCDFGLESTIVKVEDDGSVTMLRPGKITVEDISSIGVMVIVADAVTEELKEGQIALSPGMKYRHYAPNSEVVLLDGDRKSAAEYIKNQEVHKVAVICYSEDIDFYKKVLPNAEIFDFGKKEDLSLHAHLLFNILREVDKYGFDRIFAPLPTPEGIGLALYNRMIRAAAHKIIRL